MVFRVEAFKAYLYNIIAYSQVSYKLYNTALTIVENETELSHRQLKHSEIFTSYFMSGTCNFLIFSPKALYKYRLKGKYQGNTGAM